MVIQEIFSLAPPPQIVPHFISYSLIQVVSVPLTHETALERTNCTHFTTGMIVTSLPTNLGHWG